MVFIFHTAFVTRVNSLHKDFLHRHLPLSTKLSSFEMSYNRLIFQFFGYIYMARAS